MSAVDGLRPDPRLTRRRQAVRRARRRSVAARASVAGVVALGVWAGLYSPLLRVREVEVVGARRVTPEHVAGAAGVDDDDNLLLLSTEAVERRTRALTWVASVHVSRVLPGTVRVRVSEREPALVVTGGGERFTADADGRVLQRGEARRGLVVLAGMDVGAVDVGERVADDRARAALRAFRSLPARLKRRVEALFAPTPDRIGLSLRGSVVVGYGAAEEMRRKAKVISALLDRLEAEDRAPAYIDVGVPTNPAWSGRLPQWAD